MAFLSWLAHFKAKPLSSAGSAFGRSALIVNGAAIKSKKTVLWVTRVLRTYGYDKRALCSDQGVCLFAVALAVAPEPSVTVKVAASSAPSGNRWVTVRPDADPPPLKVQRQASTRFCPPAACPATKTVRELAR